MHIFSSLIVLPLFCVGFLFITGVVLLFALWRRTRTIQASMQKIEGLEKKVPSLSEKDAAQNQPSEEQPDNSAGSSTTAFACPACGGENQTGATACQYCGRRF